MSTMGNFQQDRRMIVLVLIGLCVSLPHLYTTLGGVPECGDKPQDQPRIVWLETAAAQGSGLYRLDTSPRTWPAMTADLGFQFSAESLPTGVDVPLPAYRLQADGQLQAISPPAQADPIFFQPISINQASIETLMVIPGIGRRLAALIIDYRYRKGGIGNRSSLLEIEGVGEKKAEVIAGYVRFE